MPGSFGRLYEPCVMTTKRARISSPRLVVSRQRLIVVVPPHRANLGGEDRTVVEPEMLADPLAVLEDLGAVGELLRGYEVELLQQRDVAVRIVVALDAWESVPVPDSTEVATHLDDVHVVDARLLEVCARQQAGDATAEDRDLDVLVDRGARCTGVCGSTSANSAKSSLSSRYCVGPSGRNRLSRSWSYFSRSASMSMSSGVSVGPQVSTASSIKAHWLFSSSSCGSPVPMYFASCVCRLTVLRSRYGLGSVPGKPADFMPCCTAAMLEKSCGSTESQFGESFGV